MLLRKPYWSTRFTITIDGKAQPVKNNNETVVLNRVLAKGNKITVNFTMPVKFGGRHQLSGLHYLSKRPQILIADKSLDSALVKGFSMKAITV